MTNCAAPRCKHSHKNCNLYRFPSEIGRRMVWIKRSRRPFATTNHRLCKHHFRANCFQVKAGRRILVRTAVPTIFNSTESPKKKVKSRKKKMRNDKNENHSAEGMNSSIHLRIADCWSEQDKDQSNNELLNAIYETSSSSNPLDDSPIEVEEQSADNESLGLENIPITGSDIVGESNIEFSYSTPKKPNDLTPILKKWSPRINNVTSIIEDLIDSSDDDEDQCEQEDDSNHVIYIDEDSVKQEGFVDENSEEDFDCESNRSSKKDREESLSSSFDEERIKKEFNIIDNLQIRLDKLNTNGKSIYNFRLNLNPPSKTCNETLSKKKSNRSSSSSSKKKLPKKPAYSKPSPKSRKTAQTNSRSKASHSKAKPNRSNAPEQKSQNTARTAANNKRQSLRLSGKSPEIKSPEKAPSLTRSGKTRVYEEPKSKSTNHPVYTIDDHEVPHRSSRTCVKKEPRNEEISRSRSPSPSAYKENFEVIFVCQCCNKKYASLEYVKEHVRTHFPDCATN